MKFKFLSFLFLSLSFMSFSQESETNTPNNKNKLSIGVYSGYLYSLNAYISTPDDNFTYDEKNGGFTYGAELGYFITKRLRPRLTVGYNQSSYYAYWLRSNIRKTKVKQQKFEVDLNFDYLIVNKSKFQFFASIGAVSEYLANVKYKNYEDDGDTNSNNYDEISDSYPTSNFGANFSFIAKIKIMDNMSLNISPGYNYYLKEFISSNSEPYHKFIGKGGIEWTF